MTPPATEPVGRDSWGVLYASVWLAFLVFPVVAAVQLDEPGWHVAGVLVAIAVFAGSYVVAWLASDRDPSGDERRTPWFALALLALWAGISTQLAESAMGMLVFVVVLCCLLGSTRTATVAVVGVPVLAVLVWSVVGGVAAGFLVGLVAMMTVVSVLLRGMEQHREARQAIQDQATISQERDRVARDVHDVLGHSLTVMITKAELAERLVERDPNRAVVELRAIQSLGREALTEVRATVAGLRVARLSDELAGAAEALRSAGIVADVPDDPQVVDPRRRLVLAWVLREAVTNVVRHSGAAHCRVELGAHSLVVSDDGRGTTGAVPGNGLRGVEERVRAAGGTLTLDSLTPGDTAPGTRLEVAWA